jgi:hypothetical protein
MMQVGSITLGSLNHCLPCLCYQTLTFCFPSCFLPPQVVIEVVNDGLRPTIPKEFRHSPIVPLMQDCWSADPTDRPTFEVVVDRLEAVVRAHVADSESGA